MVGSGAMVELLELARRQHGVLSRTQALLSGFTKAQVHTRLARGEWCRELPGVFRVGWAAPTLMQRVWCAALWAGEDALVSHGTAAWLWGVAEEPSILEVSSPSRLSPPQPWVRAHQTPLPPHVHGERDGLPLTSAARTLVDMAAELETEPLQAMLERAVQQGLVTMGELQRVLAEMPPRGRAGTGRIARLLERMAPPPAADGPGELALRALRLFKDARLPHPEARYSVMESGFCLAVADFAWPRERVVVELESAPEARTGPAALEANTRRTALEGHGWHVLRMSGADVEENAGAFAHSLSMLLAARAVLPKANEDNSIRAVARSAIASLIGGDRR